MRLTAARKEEIIVHDIISIRCDICGVTTTDIPDWTAIDRGARQPNDCILVRREPHGEGSLETSYDVCPQCWQQAIVGLMGANVPETQTFIG